MEDEDPRFFPPGGGMKFGLTTFPERKEVPGLPLVNFIFSIGLVDIPAVTTVEYIHLYSEIYPICFVTLAQSAF